MERRRGHNAVARKLRETYRKLKLCRQLNDSLLRIKIQRNDPGTVIRNWFETRWLWGLSRLEVMAHSEWVLVPPGLAGFVRLEL